MLPRRQCPDIFQQFFKTSDGGLEYGFSLLWARGIREAVGAVPGHFLEGAQQAHRPGGQEVAPGLGQGNVRQRAGAAGA